MQVPAYYDQIVGDLYLVRGSAALAKGSVDTLQEGGGTSVLPPQEQKVAALPANPPPIASFTRSNSGWMVNVSLPEAATQFGYRIGDKGEFTDAGLLDALDQRTGTRMPKTSFEMAKKILEQFWTSWIAFREYNGMLVYFTQLVTYRCASKRATAWAISRWTRSSSCRHAIRRTRTASPDGALYEGSAEDGLDAGAAHFMPMARSRRRGASTRRNSRGFSLLRLAR